MPPDTPHPHDEKAATLRVAGTLPLPNPVRPDTRFTSAQKKGADPQRVGALFLCLLASRHFFAFRNAACAAARRATGTRNGEHET